LCAPILEPTPPRPCGDIGVGRRHSANQKEGRLHAFADEYKGCGWEGQRDVVEGEHHLMVFERQALAVLHDAKPGMLERIHHDGATRSKPVWISRALGAGPPRPPAATSTASFSLLLTSEANRGAPALKNVNGTPLDPRAILNP
jgi:hypothetical protein